MNLIDINVKFIGFRHEEYTREEQRYENISNFFLRIIERYSNSNYLLHKNPTINLEDLNNDCEFNENLKINYKSDDKREDEDED